MVRVRVVNARVKVVSVIIIKIVQQTTFFDLRLDVIVRGKIYIPKMYSKRSPTRFDIKTIVVLSLKLLTNNRVENLPSLFI